MYYINLKITVFEEFQEIVTIDGVLETPNFPAIIQGKAFVHKTDNVFEHLDDNKKTPEEKFKRLKMLFVTYENLKRMYLKKSFESLEIYKAAETVYEEFLLNDFNWQDAPEDIPIIKLLNQEFSKFTSKILQQFSKIILSFDNKHFYDFIKTFDHKEQLGNMYHVISTVKEDLKTIHEEFKNYVGLQHFLEDAKYVIEPALDNNDNVLLALRQKISKVSMNYTEDIAEYNKKGFSAQEAKNIINYVNSRDAVIATGKYQAFPEFNFLDMFYIRIQDSRTKKRKIQIWRKENLFRSKVIDFEKNLEKYREAAKNDKQKEQIPKNKIETIFKKMSFFRYIDEVEDADIVLSENPNPELLHKFPNAKVFIVKEMSKTAHFMINLITINKLRKNEGKEHLSVIVLGDGYDELVSLSNSEEMSIAIAAIPHESKVDVKIVPNPSKKFIDILEVVRKKIPDDIKVKYVTDWSKIKNINIPQRDGNFFTVKLQRIVNEFEDVSIGSDIGLLRSEFVTNPYINKEVPSPEEIVASLALVTVAANNVVDIRVTDTDPAKDYRDKKAYYEIVFNEYPNTKVIVICNENDIDHFEVSMDIEEGLVTKFINKERELKEANKDFGKYWYDHIENKLVRKFTFDRKIAPGLLRMETERQLRAEKNELIDMLPSEVRKNSEIIDKLNEFYNEMIEGVINVDEIQNDVEQILQQPVNINNSLKVVEGIALLLKEDNLLLLKNQFEGILLLANKFKDREYSIILPKVKEVEEVKRSYEIFKEKSHFTEDNNISFSIMLEKTKLLHQDYQNPLDINKVELIEKYEFKKLKQILMLPYVRKIKFGTNDLAADIEQKQREKKSVEYSPLFFATIIKSFKTIKEMNELRKKEGLEPVEASVCGMIASDPIYVQYLIAIAYYYGVPLSLAVADANVQQISDISNSYKDYKEILSLFDLVKKYATGLERDPRILSNNELINDLRKRPEKSSSKQKIN